MKESCFGGFEYRISNYNNIPKLAMYTLPTFVQLAFHWETNSNAKIEYKTQKCYPAQKTLLIDFANGKTH